MLDEDFDVGEHGFLDSAAVLGAVDLVISCDTSIAHLAGALDRPVWIALNRDPEWHWQRRGDAPGHVRQDAARSSADAAF